MPFGIAVIQDKDSTLTSYIKIPEDGPKFEYWNIGIPPTHGRELHLLNVQCKHCDQYTLLSEAKYRIVGFQTKDGVQVETTFFCKHCKKELCKRYQLYDPLEVFEID